MSSSGMAGNPARFATSAALWQLTLWFVAMMFVGTFQYGWSLFIGPIDAAHHWGRAAINVAFTIFVFTEAFSTVPIGVLLQRHGEKKMVFVSGLLLGIAGCIFFFATSLVGLYLGAFVGGIGVGIISCAAPYGAVKWFPQKRGLATGIVVTGFVGGSLLTVLTINGVIGEVGYAKTFLMVGLAQAVALMAIAAFIRSPTWREAPVQERDAEPRFESVREVLGTSEIRAALRSPAFWLLFAIFTLVGAGGLMATAQFVPMATDFKVAQLPVNFLWFTMAAVPLALTFDRWMNALCRPIFGWISDLAGREFTMCLAFGLEALSIYLFINHAHDPLSFVVFSGLIFFGWGELFSVMPTTIADTFGTKYATTIYGILYSAKGVGAIFVPLANSAMSAFGWSWYSVFYAAVVFDIIAVVLAFILYEYRKSIGNL